MNKQIVIEPAVTYALSWASGLITFSRRLTKKEKDGAIVIASGNSRELKPLVSVLARHGYTPGVLLVPGIPEARTDEEKLDALMRFSKLVMDRLPGKKGEVQVPGR